MKLSATENRWQQQLAHTGRPQSISFNCSPKNELQEEDAAGLRALTPPPLLLLLHRLTVKACCVLTCRIGLMRWNIKLMFSFAWQNICFLIFTPFQRWKHKANLFSHRRHVCFLFCFFRWKKRSNILWKWVNKRNQFFWWKKIVHGKKGKIHLRNQNSFFFFTFEL